MRVLHLGKYCPEFREGGIEIFSTDLINYLNSQKIKADMLCFSKANYKRGCYYNSKLSFVLNSAPISWAYTKVFFHIKDNYDILHIHSPNPLAEMLSLVFKGRKIIHWHSDIVQQKLSYLAYKPIQNVVLKSSDVIIVTSPNYLFSSQQLKNFEKKIKVIPLGVNPKRLKNLEIKTQYYNYLKSLKQKKKKIIISIGRLVEYKGYPYLIEAARYLPHDFVVLIIGKGPLFLKLKNLIIRYNLKDRVYILPDVDNVNPFLKESHVVCLPSISRNEAFGLVLLEALFWGKPLITTDVEGSGMNFVNLNGITGLVVPPRNPKALSRAILAILEDDQKYHFFSLNAKKRFQEFTIDKVGDKIINLYRELVYDNRNV